MERVLLLFDDDPSPPPASESVAPSWLPRGPEAPARGRVLEVTLIFIAAVLTVGVVVAALDMKFEADQARWEQRQTCLEWYRLQADYKVGPWYTKLPAAAADCGGGAADDGMPLVPGGSSPALLQSDLPAAALATPSPTSGAAPTPTPGAAPTPTAG